MREKVMYVKLPEGEKNRKAELTQSGKVTNNYNETRNCKDNATQPIIVTSEAIKPIPLIGGTNVYKKKNGTNYWYCKIKGMDEFMFLSFKDITERDLLYDAKGKKRSFSTYRQKKFKEDSLNAILNKPAEGFRWIPVYEPSMSESGKIQFVPDKEVLRGLNSYMWKKLLSDYSPENESQEASKTTYFLLLMRWLKDGFVTLEQIADHSEEIGHFVDSKNAKSYCEKTGMREFGGLYGFVGNTCKAVVDPESKSGFSAIGGCYYVSGNVFPLADVCHNYNPYAIFNEEVAFLELKK